MRKVVTLCMITSLVLLLSASVAFGDQDFKVKKATLEPLKTEYAKGEILVKFKTGVKVMEINRIHAKHGSSEMYASPRGGFRRIKVPATMTVEEAVNIYRADPDVEYAEPNYTFHALMTPNDPYYSYQWHMPMINMGQAWNLSTGSGVVVAIIDCGVAYEDYGNFYQAPDLAGTNFVQGYDYVNNDSHPNDDNAHGTHVAGTVAQTTNNNLGVTGVAFDCSIMPVKVLDASGNGYLSDVADGIYYAADNGAHVINMSLGSTSSSSTLQNACEYAYNKGVTVVCAAGNGGNSTPQYPASYSVCISVSAVRIDSTISYYSSYGSNIDICAPGGDLNVDQNGDGYGDGVLQQTHDGSDYSNFSYYFYHGTSMASPHVAGVAALVLAKAGGGGSLTPDQVRGYLEDYAVDLGSSGWDQYYGNGLLDAYASVNAVSGGSAPVAAFTGSPTSGCVSLTVNFTDQSTNSPTSWSWAFGDGGTSTAQNPSHTYTAAGTYTVALTATNAYGSDTETKTGYITVNDVPTAAFTGSPTSGEVPLTVNFTNQSTGASSYSWTFGDGGTSTATNPSHTYTETGTFTVALTATNSCGNDTETKTNYITVTCTPPVAEFSGSPTSGDAPLTVDFTDLSTGATSWLWDFGDTETSTAQNPSHTYTAVGTYTVALTATNSCGNDTETKTDYITVTCTPPVAEFSGSPTSGDAPLTVDFTDLSTGATSWLWDFGDTETSTAQNPSHTYTAVGTYTVALTATNSCGNDTETKTDYITVTEGGDWAVITYDDFEGGWGNYTDGGGDCYLYTGGTYAHQGSCAADIQDNSGTASSFYHTVGYNVSGYTELEVEFWYMPISMDRTGEDFWVQYYDGSTWQTVATFDKGVDFENNNFYHEVVAISSSQYNFPTNARLRFMCDASGNQDDVYIDEIEFRGMSAGPMPPVADFYGSPTSGVAPLEVTFTDQSSGNPTGWNWTFGDGGTSTIQNPLHTYTDPGTYTVSLTATNAYGNDTETKTGYITVTEASENTMHVDDITVTKESWWILRRGNATVKIVDASGNPVEGATVSGEWSGGASDKDNFTTGSNGTGSCVSDWLWGDATFTFCVTDVTKSGWTYDSDANVMTCADDAGNTYGALAGAGLTDIEEIESVIGRPLVTIAPNPFNPITRISFALPKASHVSLDIYNILGQHVENLADGQFEAGEHSVTWDATDDYGRKVSSGIYFFRITFNHRELITRKMILLK